MRDLVIVAHPDDEALGLSGHLVGSDAHVLFVTDGTPDPRIDPTPYEHRPYSDEYRAMRRAEAQRSLAIAGISSYGFLDLPCQEVSSHLDDLVFMIRDEIERIRPERVITHDYEGGNLDHDLVSIAVHATSSAPVWRFPLYHLEASGIVHAKPVRVEAGIPIAVPAQRAAMIDAYASQAHETRWFTQVNEEWLLPTRLQDFTLRVPIQYERRHPGAYTAIALPFSEVVR